MAGLPILWKGAGEHTGTALVMLPGGSYEDVFIADASGKKIASGRRNSTHVPEPGEKPGEFGIKYEFGKPGGAFGGNFLIGVTQNGKTTYTAVPNGAGEFRGHVDPGEGTLQNPAQIAPYGPLGGAGMTGVPGQFTPGQIGQFGAVPSYIGGMFPNPQLAQFNSIQSAPYKFTDPIKYAKQFGEFNRGEINKNFNLSSDLALKELGTELEGLKNFVPAASALKRNEISIDNQFNQQQRTQQVNQTLPHAAGDLEAQRQRANSYASGNIPDATQNAAYELGIRSGAADRAAAGGFGASSSVARKESDLMSAAERVNLSKYGDQLLGQNLGQTAGLFLAPTEYSNAGNQINVNPSLSASQLINSNLNAINGLTTITPGQGLASTTQQNQFTTDQEQQTRQFNSTRQFQASTFNANAQNEFALSRFGYNAGYANSVAGAAQTDINTNFGLQQQQMFAQLMGQYMQQTQNAGLLNSAANIGGGILNTVLGGASKVTGKGGGKGGSSDPTGAGGFLNAAGDLANATGGGGEILNSIGSALGIG